MLLLLLLLLVVVLVLVLLVLLFVDVCCCLLLFVVPSGPLSARTERDAVLQGTAVFMSYLPVYAGFRDTMGWGGVGQ